MNFHLFVDMFSFDASKVVHFDELLSRQAPPPPPASWERCGTELRVGPYVA